MAEAKKKGGRPATGATATLSISIEPELKERLAKLAREDRRSVSSYTSILIKRALEDMDNGK